MTYTVSSGTLNPTQLNSASLPGIAHGGQQTEPNQTLPNGGVNSADASGVRWHRIANVNETIEIRLLVSRGPKTF